ncbi:MAG: divergent polysaccharide deacetylase family protein, partial [Acidobacteria bacterium]|nr:divergent polysaccharide deacetylase family protein [Acidobacteriota bacterium]MDW7983404.1 divergent polysaccharide deacetylase family protein [Acidobacteriota bacterium]
MNLRTTSTLGLSFVSIVLVTFALLVFVFEGHRPLPPPPAVSASLRPQVSGPPVVRLRMAPGLRMDSLSDGPVGGRLNSRTPSPPNCPTVEWPNCRTTESPSPSGAPVVWVIDDMGRDVETAEIVLRWPVAVSIAVLPEGAVAGWLARQACRQGRDVLIHLPMTSVRPDVDPGPMAISARMTDAEVEHILTQARHVVACATGLNQHMGSQASQVARTMDRVVRIGQSLGLRFFIDSRTAARSHLCDAADRLGVPCLRRTLFFDAEAPPEKLPDRWRQVVAHARRSAQPVVVIAHPYPATLAFLDWIFQTGAWRAVHWRRPSEV